MTIGKGRQKVDVVGHDDEIQHLVTFSIKVQQTFSHNAGCFRQTQNAFTVADIQFAMPAIGKAVMKFINHFGRKLMQRGLPAWL